MIKEKVNLNLAQINRPGNVQAQDSYMSPISESLARELDEAWEEMKKPGAKWLTLQEIFDNFETLKIKNVRS